MIRLSDTLIVDIGAQLAAHLRWPFAHASDCYAKQLDHFTIYSAERHASIELCTPSCRHVPTRITRTLGGDASAVRHRRAQRHM